MAVTYGFFDSRNGDRKYNADQMSEYFRGIVSGGVFQHLDGGLQVTAGTGLSVNVAAGRAIVQNRWIQNSASLPLSISAASETYGRKDAVVLRLDSSARTVSITVKTGTPAASPAAPSMTRSGGVYEMALAYVNVAAGATSVTVTDKRSDSSVCGWAAVAQAASGEVDQMLNDMKTGFDGVTYDSPVEMVQECDQKLQDEIDDIKDSMEYVYQNYNVTYESNAGYYAFGTGSTFTAYSGIYTSEKITVTDKHICLTGGWWYACPALVLYDANDQFIGNYPASRPSGETDGVYNDIEIVLPDDCAKVRIQNIHGKLSDIPQASIAFAVDYIAKKAHYAMESDDYQDFANSSLVPGLYEDQTISYEETQGYYMFGNGTTFYPYNNVYCSVPIAVISRYIKFTGSWWASVPAMIYYNSANEFIGNYPASKPSGEDGGNYSDVEITLPSDCAYIRVQNVHNLRPKYNAPVLAFSTGYDAKVARHALTADEIVGPVYATTHPLYGKKLVTAGDSYTAAIFDGDYNGKNYGYYVAQRHNMTFINAGISGSIMALDKTYVDDPDNVPITTRNPFSYQRYLNVPADTDYLTIWFGINDSGHTYLGTISDETNESFYGAWNVVLRYFLTNYPFMKIGIIVTVGPTEEYRQAVRDVAEKWGYPYLDWPNDKKVPAFFDRIGMSEEAKALRREAFGFTTYSSHPSPQWHEYASTIYENFLMSL